MSSSDSEKESAPSSPSPPAKPAARAPRGSGKKGATASRGVKRPNDGPLPEPRTRSRARTAAAEAKDANPPATAGDALDGGTPAVEVVANPFLVCGTLGEGDNAAQVHESTPVRPRRLKKREEAEETTTDVLPAQVQESTSVGSRRLKKREEVEEATTRVTPAQLFEQLSYDEKMNFFSNFLKTSNVEEPNMEAVDVCHSPRRRDQSPDDPPLKLVSFIDSEAEEGDPSDSEDSESRSMSELSDVPSEPSERPTSPSPTDAELASDVKKRPAYPSECQVSSPETDDPMLRALNENAKPLWKPQWYLSGSGANVQFFAPSDWKEWPGAPMKAILSVFEMTREDNFVNIPRCDPALFNAYVTGDRQYLRIGEDSAVCLTPVCVGVSYLGTKVNKWGQKAINGILHGGEAERLFAICAMTFKTPSIKLNFWEHTMAFSTYGTSSEKPAFNKFKGMASNASVKSSPSKTPTKGRIVTALNADSDVPIFDGRAYSRFKLQRIIRAISKMDVQLTITEKMAKVGLPRYDQNLKGGSFVVVAHTAMGMPPQPGKNGETIENCLVLTFNIQWGILLLEGSEDALA